MQSTPVIQKENKYIIYEIDGRYQLRLGHVYLHSELLDQFDSWKSCFGGGYWKLSKKDKKIVLYGHSDDFGSPNKTILKESIKQCSIEKLIGVVKSVYPDITDLSGFSMIIA